MSFVPQWPTDIAILATCLLVGCTAPASKGDFDSENPASKLYAILRAGRAKDRSKIPNLVEQLDSDDPAVRMMSISALERISGTRLGYNPYAAPEARRGAIEAWVEAVNKQQFTGAGGSPTRSAPNSPRMDPP